MLLDRSHRLIPAVASTNLSIEANPINMAEHQGVINTLQGSGVALELSQLIPGLSHSFRGSLVFSLLDWHLSRGAHRVRPLVLKKYPIPGGILGGCQARLNMAG